ncbi:MAG: FAD binding domain-containing protein, partial [Actinomycetota bacterium]|nr:FAD binding domain-containing protein [Actinomycetota bacterium]
MIPLAFDYARPDSVDGALALLAEKGEDATVLAGGHSLIPVMKVRLGAPEFVIDIGRLAELDYIRVDGD